MTGAIYSSTPDAAVARAPASRRCLAVLVLMILLVGSSAYMAPAAEASTGVISGVAYQDMNRDGVQQPDEEPFVDHLIYLFNEADNLLATRRTDDAGHFRFSGLAVDANYTVAYAAAQWWEIWASWVPTTTGTIFPEHTLTLGSAPATADFGWRPIITSSTPITDVTGPEGLRVQSYNDVITAQEIYDHIASEFLVGDEASDATVRFARASNTTSSAIFRDADGQVTRVRSTVNVTYTSWLHRGDRMLAHEYGHAWTNYHNYLIQQDDGSWNALLLARGIDPDDRLGSSYEWSPSEIAAEDYRQLFASDNARSGGQINNDIPRPADVPGYADWLRHDFTQPPDAAPGEDPASDADEDDPIDGEEEDETNDSESDEPATVEGGTELALTVTASKTRGVNRALLSWNSGEAQFVDVYRDGQRIATTDTGSFVDSDIGRGSPTHTYEACRATTDDCSDPVSVRF